MEKRRLVFPEWFESNSVSTLDDFSSIENIPPEFKAELVFDGEQTFLSNILEDDTLERNVSNLVHLTKLHAAATSKEQPLDAKNGLFKALKGRAGSGGSAVSPIRI